MAVTRLLHIIAVALAASLWIPICWAAEGPNIVLLVADDIGYSDFGAFGGEISTPNIDALAGEGVRFSNFHAASSCAPTRAMLMTGIDNHSAGVGSMKELMPLSHRGKPGYDGVLNDRVQTIASLLQSAGYRTSVVGKWHLGTENHNLPPARGFDHSLVQADSGSDNFEMRPYLPMTPEARWYDNGQRMSALPADFYSSRFFVDSTIEFLEATANEDEPFFAYIAFQANHTPVQAPPEFIDRYRGHYTQGWAQVRQTRVQKIRDLGLIDDQATIAPGPTQEEWDALDPEQQYFEARRMQAYAGMATAMDYEIGRLVAYLRETGQYDNTVFVLLSDNGATVADAYQNAYGRRWLEKENYHADVETLGEKGSWVAAGNGWGRVSNTPLSGYKFFAGEGGVRVPLIISGLTGGASGSVYDDFTYITDLAPTVLEIAGLDKPEPKERLAAMTGKNLLPAIEQGSGPVYGPQDWVGYEFSGNSALYRGDFKLVRNRPPVGDGQWRLYNISDDPGETEDLSGQREGLFQEMQAEYERYVEEVGVLPMPEDYSVAKQTMINVMLFTYLPRYLPRYLPYLLGILLVVIGTYLYYRRRRAHS